MPRKFKSDAERSKYYGEKVMKAFGYAPIRWALGEAINPREWGARNDTYSGSVSEEGPGTGSRRIDHYSISDINYELTAFERRQVYANILARLGLTSVGRRAEAQLKEKEAARKKDEKYKYTVEEEIMRSALQDGKRTARDLRKGRVNIELLPEAAQYVLAIHALLTEMKKCDEILQSDSAYSEDKSRVAANRQHDKEVQEEFEKMQKESFEKRWREQKQWEAQKRWEEERERDGW